METARFFKIRFRLRHTAFHIEVISMLVGCAKADFGASAGWKRIYSK